MFSDADADAENLTAKAVDAATDAFKFWQFVLRLPNARNIFLKLRRLFVTANIISRLGCVLKLEKLGRKLTATRRRRLIFSNFTGAKCCAGLNLSRLRLMRAKTIGFTYIPLGVGAIIPPWNFPLAIMCGMTMAAVVTGNTCVLKPSPDAPTIAYKFMEVLEEIGLPAGVVNFVVGSGAAVGEQMVQSPKVRFISFTGSKNVGLHIYEEAAKTRPGQKWMKRVVAEMGGKDAIVVCADADLDSAASGVVSAAFAFQGQKCSACSRLIVDEKVHDELLEKIVALTKTLKVGLPTDGDTNVTAVINQKSIDNVQKAVETAKSEGGEVITGGNVNVESGFYVEPTIIKNVKAGSTIEQQEVFAPVLAVIKVANYDEALDVANGTDYGLTGSVYSTSQANLERARREFHVGNLYLNRKSTGALVGVHPFGGFNMSGTDSKAGGREYLLQFMQGKSVSQKI